MTAIFADWPTIRGILVLVIVPIVCAGCDRPSPSSATLSEQRLVADSGKTEKEASSSVQGNWSGRTVILRRPGVKAREATAHPSAATSDELKRIGYRIVEDRDGSLKVMEGKNALWFDK